MQQRVAELMDQLGLLELAKERFGHLSEGQRRRLLIARALVHKPDVLVLDEPTNALDLKARHQLLELMRKLSCGGTTLLLVTHQIEAVIPEIQRCVMLKAGQLMADGPCDQVLTSPNLSALFETPLQLLSANGYRQVLPG
jgi:iron complex transport system ATP-binding protein